MLIQEKLFGQKGNISATSLKVKLQKNCWDNIGPVRTKVGLDRIEKLLHEIKFSHFYSKNVMKKYNSSFKIV